MTLAIVAAYVLVTVAVGLIGNRLRERTPDDYFLAGRRVGPVVLFFTLIATNFSAFFFLGFAGAGYRIGFSYYGIMSFGTALVALAFYGIGHRAWSLGRARGYITPPEMVGDRTGSRALKFVFLAVMVFFTIPYLALQPIGAGYLLAAVTDGAIPQFLGAVLLTAFIVLYVFVGGMRSVAVTDVLQGVFMFALMVLAVVVVARAFGGIAEANARTFAVAPELFGRTGGGAFFTPRLWFSYMLLWLFAVPMFPQVFMRFFIPGSASSLRVAATLYPLVTATLFLGPILIGVWGRLAFPDLTGSDSDQILPMMMAAYAPDWLAALVMVGALAAFMSTMDSQLLALSSMLTRDVYVDVVAPRASVDRQVVVGRFLVVALSVVGLVIAYRPPATFFAIATEAFSGLAILFPSAVAVLHWRRVSPRGCLASILVGEALLAGFHYGVIPASWAMGFLPLIPILTVSTVIILATGRGAPAAVA